MNSTGNFNSIEVDNNEESNVVESKIIYANESTFEAEVLNSDKVVLVDFYADWCYPCRMLAPTLEKIAKENDDIKVVKVNVDEAQNLAIEYGATSIPLLVVIENGQEKDRLVGVLPESEILRVLKAQ
ncbi:MAG: thioredoxin [Clostridia bacterium]|nr:thioredoxin [Clostridia bacterium]